MQQPLQITVRDIDNSPAIKEHIQEKVDKLAGSAKEVISCHVVVEQTQKHQNQGKLHSVHIRLNMPGRELAVNHKENENLWIAIRDAFDSMREQLRTYRDQLRHRVKNHLEPVHGKIVRLFDDFGFILGSDGITEYYFNSGNVTSLHFDRLRVGADVHFLKSFGDDGPQAKRVSAREHGAH